MSNAASSVDPSGAPFASLPDLLNESLDVVFVGINPSIFSAHRGHYFARPTNRFWPALSRSALSRNARRALGVERLRPEHDRALPLHGIGFTDLAKRATVRASDLDADELAAGVEHLLAKLERYRPSVACFHGVTGYRYVHRFLVGKNTDVNLGPQTLRVGPTQIYLVPNPSGANAHFTLTDQTRWYDRLFDFLAVASAMRKPWSMSVLRTTGRSRRVRYIRTLPPDD